MMGDDWSPRKSCLVSTKSYGLQSKRNVDRKSYWISIQTRPDRSAMTSGLLSQSGFLNHYVYSRRCGNSEKADFGYDCPSTSTIGLAVLSAHLLFVTLQVLAATQTDYHHLSIIVSLWRSCFPVTEPTTRYVSNVKSLDSSMNLAS